MINQAFESVSDRSWVPSSAWRSLQLKESKRLELQKIDILDEVPAMSSTVLSLEMLLHEPSIDLQMATETVLSDVGATIQVLRLIGKEYEVASERPYRMGDCLASLDVRDWFGAISAHSFVCDQAHSAMTEVWRHCQKVGQYAQLAAEAFDEICPEDAYLVGLLHGCEAIPALMGWAGARPAPSEDDLLLAMEGTMPLFVLAALRSLNDRTPSAWKYILNTAHQLAETRVDMPEWNAAPTAGDSASDSASRSMSPRR